MSGLGAPSADVGLGSLWCKNALTEALMLHDRGKWFYSVNSFGIGCFLSGALVMWLPAGLSRNCLHNWLLRIVGALTAPHSYGADVPVDGAVQSINSGQLPDKQPP